ncbi:MULTISPECIES: DivIVA domain-containing protein [Microbacterium]|uniref:Cell wall synthesis protein Wag31 n=1 Tax=Microbacterium sufflavum TaxID=2851649 RepID=A0ABY4II79_9MICO|nr:MULTISPECIES: DivIVA domain-containing protein [Microbacterium]MBN6192794.1 DivIVA domain-containing protein [Aneurinibacillus sp. BA2021]MCK2027592.1 DivIVA domain-containing protein [Microbacterium sufflavum]MPS76000.1 DivIVA domain-containing protein [Microbacterium sp.]UPL12466.1 DivIVA domain-containing protein [Microbacterium sufflavum]
MALTPDDVVTKQFQHVRFKDGFDPDEVDDFLDEIVIEWRKALEENAELKAKLAAYESGAAPAAAETPAPKPVAAPAAEATPAEPAPTGSATATAGIIELAQRLHDEHVAEGEAKRNALIAEAETEVARIRTEAEAKQREESARLERERNTLEARITELRNFERDYRAQLRGYIEGQLRDLDEKSASTDSTPVSAIGL